MRMLVVEDERRIALSLKKGLEQEHYAVDVSFNGVEGLDLASAEEYDLIILDRMLPHMDGLELCRELRKKGISTPIILLTAKGQIKDKIEGLDAGADDYVAKPFSFEELLARIRALLRRPKDTASAILTVGDLNLDTKNYLVTRKQIPIALSSKEYALLEYFMRHAGQILGKEQIINHVWDYNADILPNTVEVYVKNLRSKIDDPFTQDAPLIHTVRGFGYKLESI